RSWRLIASSKDCTTSSVVEFALMLFIPPWLIDRPGLIVRASQRLEEWMYVDSRVAASVVPSVPRAPGWIDHYRAAGTVHVIVVRQNEKVPTCVGWFSLVGEVLGHD